MTPPMTPPHHSPKAPSSTPSDGIKLRAHAARAWVRSQSGQPLNTNPPHWCENKAQCRFYTNLLKGTMRNAQPLLSELNTLSPQKKAKRQPEALALALLGLYQLRFLRLPPHAVLHQTVAAAALLNRKWAKPWINAVLRHALQAPPPTVPLPIHPSWLLQRWETSYGADRTQQISQAQSHWYGAAVAVHPRRGSPQQLLQQLQQEGISASIHPHWPLALHLENLQPLLLSKTFASGAVWVQDTSSQILTTLIQPLLQGPTLDLCCAPGGKLMALATAANPPPFLLGIDIHHQRLLQTQNNLKKILPHHIPLIQADASKPLPVSPTHPWHTIILDAPCSSTGVLAKHPDALHRLSPQRIHLVSPWKRANNSLSSKNSCCSKPSPFVPHNLGWCISLALLNQKKTSGK